MKSNIVVLGATGQVGCQLVGQFSDCANVFAVNRSEVDFSQPSHFGEIFERFQPAIVINAAADTAVDRAEAEPEPSRLVNAEAPKMLAETCRNAGVRLIHFSTDYVFDGTGRRPYREDDLVAPTSNYGKHKLAGERAVLDTDPRNVVLRLSWVYLTSGRNFALTMLRLAKEGRPLRVVGDQVGSPTYARFIAQGTAQVVRSLLAEPDADGGLYHLSAGGATSWTGFAQAVLNAVLGEKAPLVLSIPTSEYPTPAKRPAYSVLDNAKIHSRFGVSLPDWQSQVSTWAVDFNAAPLPI